MATGTLRPWTATSFFASRKRCCPGCLQRTLTIDGKAVTEYYHRGVVCHLIGHELAIPLDVELLQPGEGEETAAKRLLERVFELYPRYFDVVVGDALYLDAPFINFCRAHGKHAIITIRGDQRLLLRDAQGLFRQQDPGEWAKKLPHPILGCGRLHLRRGRRGAVARAAHG